MATADPLYNPPASIASPTIVVGGSTSELALHTTNKGVKLRLTDSNGVLDLVADSSWAGTIKLGSVAVDTGYAFDLSDATKGNLLWGNGTVKGNLSWSGTGPNVGSASAHPFIFVANNVEGFRIDTNQALVMASAKKLLIDSSNSTTNVALQVNGDANTGVGQIGGADTLGLVAGGAEALRAVADAAVADTETAILIRRNVGGTVTQQRVSMGAADSGGAGFKALRVPN